MHESRRVPVVKQVNLIVSIVGAPEQLIGGEFGYDLILGRRFSYFFICVLIDMTFFSF